MKDYTSLGETDIAHRFGTHQATVEGEDATLYFHHQIRALFEEFGNKIDSLLPSGRAKSVVFTELETASMWAHKATAERAPLVVDTPDISEYNRISTED